MTNAMVKATLVAQQKDECGYITYGFKLVEDKDIEIVGSQYAVCVRFPNWNAASMKIGDSGILHFVEITAGTDKWFDGNNFNSYRYNNWQFIKFMPIRENNIDDIILD